MGNICTILEGKVDSADNQKYGAENVPKINEEFGLTEEQFAQQMELVDQYRAGNTSALDGAQ